MVGKTEEAAKEAAATPPVASAQPKVDVFEDDDEFEEFENEDWNAEEEDTTAVQQWEDDWDDDDVGDDFSKHLRAELEKGEGQKQS